MGRRLISLTRALVFIVAVAYVVVVAGLYFAQRNLIYLPDSDRPVPAAFGVPDMSPVQIRTADGLDLLAWWKPPRSPDDPVLAFFHGNAGHIGYRAFKMRPYLDQGWGVLLVSWRGYGGNSGSPTEAGLYDDGRAAVRFLADKGIEGSRLVLYGESLGTGIAVQLATEFRVGAVVLEAPYTSIVDVAESQFSFVPVGLLLKDRFESIRKIAKIAAPLLVMHGTWDGVIPVVFGRELFDAARDPKTLRLMDQAGHNDLYDFGAAQAVREFVARFILPLKRR